MNSSEERRPANAASTHMPTPSEAEDALQPEKSRNGGLKWLLILPYIALLWVPFYNQRLPDFAGFPFFYWYQLLWVPLTSLLIYIIYKVVR